MNIMRTLFLILLIFPFILFCGDKKYNFKTSFSKISRKWEGVYIGDDMGLFKVNVSYNCYINLLFGEINSVLVFQSE